MLSFLAKSLFQAMMNAVIGVVLAVGMFGYFAKNYNFDTMIEPTFTTTNYSY